MVGGISYGRIAHQRGLPQERGIDPATVLTGPRSLALPKSFPQRRGVVVAIDVVLVVVVFPVVVVLVQAPIYDENLAKIGPASPGEIIIMMIAGHNYDYNFDRAKLDRL